MGILRNNVILTKRSSQLDTIDCLISIAPMKKNNSYECPRMKAQKPWTLRKRFSFWSNATAIWTKCRKADILTKEWSEKTSATSSMKAMLVFIRIGPTQTRILGRRGKSLISILHSVIVASGSQNLVLWNRLAKAGSIRKTTKAQAISRVIQYCKCTKIQ